MTRTDDTLTSEATDDGANDLFLGTIGVVLILFVVAVVQIGVPEVSRSELEAMAAELRDAWTERNAATARAAGQQQRADSLERSLADEQRRRERSERAASAAEARSARAEAAAERAEEARKGLEFKPTDCVLVIDGTASMEPTLLALRTGVLTLSEIAARLTAFRIGVVIYNGNGVSTYSLSGITPTEGGKEGAAMLALRRFMETAAVPVSGAADVEGGLSAALEMFGPPRTGVRQQLVIAGDMGPWEIDGNGNEIHPDEERIARRVRESVHAFVRAGEGRSVLSLFTGKGTDIEHRDRTTEFLKSLTTVGTRSSYSEDLSQLTAAVVASLFAQHKGEHK